MSRTEIVKKVKQFAELIKTKFPVKMVILEKTYANEEFKKDPQIEVAVVVEGLEKDYVETKDELNAIAKKVDPRIDIDIIEMEEQDPIGFFKEVQKTGEIIYQT